MGRRWFYATRYDEFFQSQSNKVCWNVWIRVYTIAGHVIKSCLAAADHAFTSSVIWLRLNKWTKSDRSEDDVIDNDRSILGKLFGLREFGSGSISCHQKNVKIDPHLILMMMEANKFSFIFFYFSFGNRAAATSLTDTFAFHPLQQIIVASYKMTTLASATVILSSSIFQIFKTPHYVFIYNASADATHFAKHKKTLNISKKIRNSTSAKKAKL